MTFQRTPEDHKRHRRQKDAVLEHLQSGRALTQDIGETEYGIRRVAARISELKKAGHIILSLRNEQSCATYILLSPVAEGGCE